MGGSVTPVFIVGCGRSGTQALARMFDSIENTTMYHEYMIHHVQPLGVRYFHGAASREEVAKTVQRLHGAAIRFSDTPVWGDCSNKLSWFIDVLAEEFPSARFIHLVRDGRKVASSLFHKLGHECLDDISSRKMREWLDNPVLETMPPPEKKYWWPLAHDNDAEHSAYAGFDHFERIAFHWAQINREIARQLDALEQGQWMRVRLEDITRDKNLLEKVGQFAGCAIGPEQVDLMVKPHNVIKPVNYQLSEEQTEFFWKVAGDQMELFGYQNEAVYELSYDNAPERKER